MYQNVETDFHVQIASLVIVRLYAVTIKLYSKLKKGHRNRFGTF